MAMELILLEDIKDLGMIGDTVRVADGYARNYLLPRNLAAKVTKATMRRLEARKVTLQRESSERLSVAQSMAARIGGEAVTVTAEANEEDKLYGSVTEHNIVDALKEKGIEISADAVLMDEHIRELGVYNVDIHLHPEVQGSLKVWVVRK